MRNREIWNALSKEELIDIINMYAKNWLAIDGLWFQSIERKFGMDAAMTHDEEVWKSFTEIEARRIKSFLNLPDKPGLEGLAQALKMRLYSNINKYELLDQNNRLILRNIDCRVQTARRKKDMPYHPCESVGLIEYSGFAKTIDPRISCRCLSCYPNITDETTCCAWEFTLADENNINK
ncbi:MAG: hypothetical protein GX587_00970 [Bacteroidales bacterium]|nr:hypothetical protein [Bacteroidales bacterium]